MRTVPAPAPLSLSAIAAIRGIGTRFDSDVLATTRSLFEARWDLSVPAGGERRADAAYGAHERQILDVATPGASATTILLFVPGGGFVAGDKSGYAHVGPAFARLGFVTAVMNYRLAPDHAWPTGAKDVSAAIDWLADHGHELGAEGAAIQVLAQSAGAAHASAALFDARFRPRAFPRVRSAVFMSGFYKMDPALDSANLRAYFGDDPGQYVDRSPISAVATTRMPVGLTVAEFDPGVIALQTIALASALTERDGRCPPIVWNEGHNHVSPVLSIGVAPLDPAPGLARLFMRLGGEVARHNG